MEKLIRLALVSGGKLDIVTIPDNMTTIRKYIGSDSLEMPTREIKGRKLIFVSDGVALMKPMPVFNVIDDLEREGIAGNILIGGIHHKSSLEDDTDIRSLTDEEVSIIKSSFYKGKVHFDWHY